MWTIFYLVSASLILGIAAWFLFIWATKSGQFEDLEGMKYRILDDDDEKFNKIEQKKIK